MYNINDIYNLLINAIEKEIRDNLQYNEMHVFGNDEIDLYLEDGNCLTIHLTIEDSEDD